jgi:hypothetical protein
MRGRPDDCGGLGCGSFLNSVLFSVEALLQEENEKAAILKIKRYFFIMPV